MTDIAVVTVSPKSGKGQHKKTIQGDATELGDDSFFCFDSSEYREWLAAILFLRITIEEVTLTINGEAKRVTNIEQDHVMSVIHYR